MASECLTIVSERVPTGFGKFWEVVKIHNAIVQDLESFGKREVFQNGYGKVLDFCLEQF